MFLCKRNFDQSDINDEASIHKDMENKPQHISTLPTVPTLQFFEGITRNFSDEREIGRGSFGVVYKVCFKFSFSIFLKITQITHVFILMIEVKQGVLENADVVAVKKLLVIPGFNEDKQFQNEVGNLIALNHRNIVKLISYCYEIRRKVVEDNGRHVFMDMAEKLLCYEYLPRGSLDKYLYGTISLHIWFECDSYCIFIDFAVNAVRRNMLPCYPSIKSRYPNFLRCILSNRRIDPKHIFKINVPSTISIKRYETL